MRIRSLCVMLLAGLVVAGCDSDCPTPTAPTSPNPGLTVASLTISGPSELQVGQTAQLTATARYSDGTSENVTAATTWVTNNVNVCTINAAGVLTSVSAGQCTVTGVFQNQTGTIVISCFNPGGPTVNPPPSGPAGGALIIEGPSSVDVGQQIQLRAFTVDGHQEVTNQANWSGDNPGVGSIGNEGRVTGVSRGGVNVVASYNGMTGSKGVSVAGGAVPPPPTCEQLGNCPPPVCTVNCGPAATVTGLAIQGVTSIPVGQTSQLNLIASFSDGTSQNVTSQAAWSSANGGVASVNGTGLVSAVAQGSTPISASYGGQSTSVNFTVTGGGGPSTPTVNSLAVTGTTPLTVGQTSQYNAVASLSDGSTPNVNGQTQWASSNPGVASVGSTGLVTALAAGTTTISGTYQGKSGSVNLTVNAAQPDMIGLEVNVNANVLTGNGPLGLNLNLADLLNGNPILSLKVFALYSDGSKNDVTSVAAITSPTGLINIDGQDTADVIALLLQGLLNPNHQINVTYGGFTANVVVNLQLPLLQTLGFPSNNISLVNGNKLPSLNALFSQGINSTIDAGLPGVQYALTAGNGLIANALNAVLGVAGLNLNQVFSITNGVLNVSNGGLTGLLNVPIVGPVLSGLLGPGGLLPLQLTATVNGVTTAPVTVLVK